jgi:hypothetical protein
MCEISVQTGSKEVDAPLVLGIEITHADKPLAVHPPLLTTLRGTLTRDVYFIIKQAFAFRDAPDSTEIRSENGHTFR